MEKDTTPTHTFIDPVCLMQVAPSSSNITFTHKMRTYYFCAETCCDAFKRNPDKYLASMSPKPKGWWGRYLDRLRKVTKGRPPECCR